LVKVQPPPVLGDRVRLVVLAVFLSLLFSLLIARFYQVQILEGEKWMRAALSQHQTIIYEPFKRGAFYSNTSLQPGHLEDEQPFVMDVPKFHLFIDPDSIPKCLKDRMAGELFALLGIPPSAQPELRQEFNRKSRSRRLSMWLERSQKEEILHWWDGFSRR